MPIVCLLSLQQIMKTKTETIEVTGQRWAESDALSVPVMVSMSARTRMHRCSQVEVCRLASCLELH